MSFDDRDIRPAMDVYTYDNVYLGTVIELIPGPVAQSTAHQPARLSPQASVVNGELLGPMPTHPLGNPGPGTQSAHTRYAASPDSARPLGRGAIAVGKWWGLVDRRTIPLEDVQTVSLERVVLKRRTDELT